MRGEALCFDIDGTLEVGDPPGLITMDMVRAIKALGPRKRTGWYGPAPH
jgi:hypothetical protein